MTADIPDHDAAINFGNNYIKIVAERDALKATSENQKIVLDRQGREIDGLRADRLALENRLESMTKAWGELRGVVDTIKAGIVAIDQRQRKFEPLANLARDLGQQGDPADDGQPSPSFLHRKPAQIGAR
jgi:hypothetical protein